MVPGPDDTVQIAAGTEAAPVRLASGDSAAVTSLSLAPEAGNTAALFLSGDLSASLGGSIPIVIGGSGEAFLTIDGGTLLGSSTVNSTRTLVGHNVGGSGTVVINSGTWTSFNLSVGESGEGTVLIHGGTLQMNGTGSNGNQDLSLGRLAGGVGTITMDGGAISTIRTIHVGNSGTGTITVGSGATVAVNKSSSMANSAGSKGMIVIDGGTWNGTGSSGSTFGNSGSALLHVKNGTFTASATITYGASATGEGVLVIEEDGHYNGTNISIVLGSNGRGELYLRGGAIDKSGSGAKSLVIRAEESGSGLVHGWGTITITKNHTIRNNGLVVADGEGEERVLSISDTGDNSVFSNTIENTSTNGWYAIRKGKLSIAMRSTSLAAGDSGEFTWGESEFDDTIDLVNSARMTCYAITGRYGIQSITGSIYAADRSDAHIEDLPSAATKVGVWGFTLGGSGSSCTSYDIQLRYDHVAARGNVLTLWHHDGTSWVRMNGAVWDAENHIVSVNGLAPNGSTLGLFAVTGIQPETVVLIR